MASSARTRRAETAPPLSEKELRDTSWEIGKAYPRPFSQDFAALMPVIPGRIFAIWNIAPSTIERIRTSCGNAWHGCRPVLRVYDVTLIDFDGKNAHVWFDVDVGSCSGNYYLNIGWSERNAVAEMGFRLTTGAFHPASRSNVIFVDRGRPSGAYQAAGLYVESGFKKVLRVENVLNAGAFEDIARVESKTPAATRSAVPRVAVVKARIGEEPGDSILTLVRSIAEKCTALGVQTPVFANQQGRAHARGPVAAAESACKGLLDEILTAHKKQPFGLIHCHEWYSAAGIDARKLGIPMVLTLYATEAQRRGSAPVDAASEAIAKCEKRACEAADLVIVPSDTAAQQLVDVYGVSRSKLAVVPQAISVRSDGSGPTPAEMKQTLGLGNGPVVFFCGEMSHAAGADMLVAVIPNVSGEHPSAQFVFAGDGPLRGELESAAHNSGVAQKCRFLGHTPPDLFESVLAACDFVVLPARTWQEDGVAKRAIACGKPVLTTHQANLPSIKHGQNGLLTYDNPGSIEWGVKELLSNPQAGGTIRSRAEHEATGVHSSEATAARYVGLYQDLLAKGAAHA